ncbi:MAG: GNAT family N-acetyltransferase [Cyclobacteriaceae bacterium]|nr:GNAT family N-acetyltransferase [Cyclobacteriaceae bacterium]
MEYLIREIKKTDLPRLIELCKSHADYEQTPYVVVEKANLLQSALFSGNKKLYCFVVEHHAQLIGYYSYTFDFSTWDAKPFMYLDCLYLEPEFRGMKIGEKIFESLKKIGALNNCANIQWLTPSFNERAIKFYKRMGGTGIDKIRFFVNL